MTSSLRFYHTLIAEVGQQVAGMRVTQVRMIALMAVGMIMSRSVWLSEIACHLPVRRGKLPSLVNRLHRFLVNSRIEPLEVLRPFARRLLTQQGLTGVRLVMDASKVGVHGQRGSRVLTVSLCYRKRTLPLLHLVAPGPKGQVGWEMQKRLLKAVAALIPAQTPVVLVADAGFESVELILWLQQQHWDFVLRRNGKNSVRLQRQHVVLGKHALADFVRLDALTIRAGEIHHPGAVFLTKRHAIDHCYLTLCWQRGEASPWYLIASFDDAKRALQTYRRRMWVEEMYGDLKQHGFNIAASHLRHADRIERLLMVAFIAYLVCISLGSRIVKNGRRSQVDHKSRRNKSYFRIGHDWLRMRLQRDKSVKVSLSPAPN